MTALLKAQSFEYIYSTTDDEIIMDAAQDTAGNYYLVGKRGFYNYPYNSIIIKLNPFGDTAKTVTFPYPPGGSALIRQVLSISDTTFAAIGMVVDSVPALPQIWYVKFDTNLNILDEKVIGDVTRSHFVSSIHKSLKNEILIAGGFMDYPWQAMIYRLSLDGDSLQSFLIGDTSSNYKFAYDILDLPDSSGYLISGVGFVQPNASNQLIRTDTNGIIDSVYLLTAFSSIGGVHLLWLSDTTYALSTLAYDTSYFASNPVLSFNVFDRNFNRFGDTIVGPHDTLDNLPLRSIDLITTENVFGGGSINWHGLLFEAYPAYYHAVKLNSSMEVQWEKIISHNDDFLNLWCVKATNDGGVLLAGSRYNYQTSGFNERDIYVIKLDSLGNFTTGINNPTITTQVHDVIIYPNPAYDIINIRSTINFPATEIILYDASGRAVMDKKISSPSGRQGGASASFSVKQLNAGIYFYKIKDAKGNEVRGKVVRE